MVRKFNRVRVAFSTLYKGYRYVSVGVRGHLRHLHPYSGQSPVTTGQCTLDPTTCPSYAMVTAIPGHGRLPQPGGYLTMDKLPLHLVQWLYALIAPHRDPLMSIFFNCPAESTCCNRYWPGAWGLLSGKITTVLAPPPTQSTLPAKSKPVVCLLPVLSAGLLEGQNTLTTHPTHPPHTHILTHTPHSVLGLIWEGVYHEWCLHGGDPGVIRRRGR